MTAADPIAAVELALTAALAAAGADDGPLGYRYRTLETYPEEFDTYLKDKGALRCPAAWAVFLGIAQGSDAKDDSGWSGVGRFALVVAAENKRGETETRHGGPEGSGDVGAYKLAVDAVRLLSLSGLGLDLHRAVEIKSLRLVARSAEMRRQGLALMAIELECGVSLGMFGEEPAEFEAFHADWDVPPHGNVVPPLPAANPDAEDYLELSDD